MDSKQNFMGALEECSFFQCGQNEYKKSFDMIKTEQNVKFLCGFLTNLHGSLRTGFVSSLYAHNPIWQKSLL